jgi:hypothetical protein
MGSIPHTILRITVRICLINGLLDGGLMTKMLKLTHYPRPVVGSHFLKAARRNADAGLRGCHA